MTCDTKGAERHLRKKERKKEVYTYISQDTKDAERHLTS
jgi:hypothetical protein